MKRFPGVLAGLVVQLLLIGFAIYVVVSDGAFPGSPTATRVAVVTLLLVVALLVGEVSRIRAHMAALLSVLQAGVASSAARDDRAAVGVLIQALESDAADIRAKAHKNLVRITKQDLPADPVAWKAWWDGAKDGFPTGRAGG